MSKICDFGNCPTDCDCHSDDRREIGRLKAEVEGKARELDKALSDLKESERQGNIVINALVKSREEVAALKAENTDLFRGANAECKRLELQNSALIAAMREALMRPENWREAINTALNDLDKSSLNRDSAPRKHILNCLDGVKLGNVGDTEKPKVCICGGIDGNPLPSGFKTSFGLKCPTHGDVEKRVNEEECQHIPCPCTDCKRLGAVCNICDKPIPPQKRSR